MLRQKMKLCALTLPLALAACGSHQQTLQPVSSPQASIPAPAAWAMQHKSTSRQKVDALFSFSEPARLRTEKGFNHFSVLNRAGSEIENSASTFWREVDLCCIAHAAGAGMLACGELTGCKVC